MACWTDERIKYLKDNFPYVTPLTLSKEMGIPKDEIKRKGVELGLVKMVIRNTRTETHAPCAGCRKWHPVEDFNLNAKACRGLQDNCREYDRNFRKKNPIDDNTKAKYLKNAKRNKELKELRTSKKYKSDMVKLSKKKETENQTIVCKQCGKEKIGRMFGFKNLKRKHVCLECEKYNRDMIKAQKILSGEDY